METRSLFRSLLTAVVLFVPTVAARAQIVRYATDFPDALTVS